MGLLGLLNSKNIQAGKRNVMAAISFYSNFFMKNWSNHWLTVWLEISWDLV